MTEENLANFLYLLRGEMLLYQNAFVLGREGTSDSSLQTVTLATMLAIIEQPDFKLYWGQRQSVFIQSFQHYISELEPQEGSSLTELYN